MVVFVGRCLLSLGCHLLVFDLPACSGWLWFAVDCCRGLWFVGGFAVDVAVAVVGKYCCCCCCSLKLVAYYCYSLLLSFVIFCYDLHVLRMLEQVRGCSFGHD